MAEQAFFANMVKQPVFYNFGPSPRNTPRYVRAPFNIVKIDGVVYLEPRPVGDASDVAAQLAAQDNEDESTVQAREDFGYFGGGMVMVDENEMGDFQGHPEDWKGVHAFGHF